MEKRICKYCEQEFDLSPRVFSNHVRWCVKNPNASDLRKLKLANEKSMEDRFGKLVSFNVKCKNCLVSFNTIERDKSFPKKENYFCSRSCANTRKHTDETKAKISETNKKLPDEICGRKQKEKRICEFCNNFFEVKVVSLQRFCNRKCKIDYVRQEVAPFRKYQLECAFKFNVYKFPDKFDLNLIEQYGWYKAKNRGNNLEGVSRDHMVSIKYGWENDISSEIISHPANCKLMRQIENSSKNCKCSITYEELRSRIKNWNGSQV